MEIEIKIAMPGSPNAVKDGCTCPTVHNNHGEGTPTLGGVRYILNETCPIHCFAGLKK